ncbi:MAG: AAA family ATPase, partial [Coriobacteriia bacterium]|nr:AAA family ATPase [Coriobacteriia bacterium]
WKAMFLDAKVFSTEVAFPGEEFPVVGDGSRCVLCHQTLDETAKDRLTRFADFIGNQAEKRARDAAKVYGDLRTGAIEAAKGIGGIDDAFVEQVLERADATATALKTMRTDFTKWQTSAEAVSSHDQWSKLIGPAAGISTVTALATKPTKEADELDKNSNADALVKLKGNLSLLNNRIALAKVLPTIIESAGAAATKRRLQVLSNTIDTAHVSRQATKTTQAVLTDALCLALNTELDALDAESLKVEFVKKGDGGGVLHYLRLKNAPRNTKIEEILSEGEHRCLAMAAFLAELGQQGHSSAIVLDDPVSSLDHKHRDKLATRLVEEAKHRQVIILSHDLAFLYAIDQAAALAQVPVRQHAVARTSDGTGVPVDGLYPEAMKLNDLIKHIKKLADEVAAMDPNDIARRGKVVDCYDLIRAAWERVVEESLLRSVVGPFDKAVHAQMLKGVFVEDEDHSTVFWAMTKASNIVDAHRTPAGGGTTVIPKDTEIAADIEQLRAFKKAADARAQEVIARRKKLESPPTH